MTPADPAPPAPGGPTPAAEPDLAAVATRLGHPFADPALLRQALTHPARNREEGHVHGDYQRLEYLGDAVLDATLATTLHALLPRADEGELTRRHNLLADGKTLAGLARELGLDAAVLLGGGVPESVRRGDRIPEDVIEACFGAVYLDGGWEAARACILRCYGDLLARSELAGEDNAKGRLQERLQGANPDVRIEYVILREDGPPNDRTYLAEVRVDGSPAGQGSGRRKREAEQAAARAALDFQA